MDKFPLYNSRDNKFVEETGMKVSSWVDVLDTWDALTKGHTKMTIYVEQNFNLTPDWAQAVAVRHQKEKLISN